MEDQLAQLMKMIVEMKTDMVEMKTDIKRDLEENKTDMKKDIVEIKTDMEENKTENKELLNGLFLKVDTITEKMCKEVENVKEEVENVKDEVGNVKAEVDNVNEKVENIREEVQKEIMDIKKNMDERLRHGLISAAAPAGLKVKPPPYDGQISFETYKLQFEAACLANRWNDQEKATALVLALRGTALDMLRTLPRGDQEDYQRLTSALELRFGEQHLQQLFRTQLRARKQKPTESLQEFEADIKRLIHMAYPTAPVELLEEMATRSFIDGIKDDTIRNALLLTSYNTTRDALGKALEIEAAHKASAATWGSSKIRAVQVAEEEDPIKNLSMQMKQLMDTLSSRNSSRGRPVCYGCGKPGHLRRQCRSSAAAPRRDEQQEN